MPPMWSYEDPDDAYILHGGRFRALFTQPNIRSSDTPAMVLTSLHPSENFNPDLPYFHNTDPDTAPLYTSAEAIQRCLESVNFLTRDHADAVAVAGIAQPILNFLAQMFIASLVNKKDLYDLPAALRSAQFEGLPSSVLPRGESCYVALLFTSGKWIDTLDRKQYLSQTNSLLQRVLKHLKQLYQFGLRLSCVDAHVVYENKCAKLDDEKYDFFIPPSLKNNIAAYRYGIIVKLEAIN